MISVVGIVVSLVLIVLMIGNLYSSALRACRQQKNVQVAGARARGTQGLVLVQTRQGMMVSAREPVSRSPLVLPPDTGHLLHRDRALSVPCVRQEPSRCLRDSHRTARKLAYHSSIIGT